MVPYLIYTKLGEKICFMYVHLLSQILIKYCFIHPLGIVRATLSAPTPPGGHPQVFECCRDLPYLEVI